MKISERLLQKLTIWAIDKITFDDPDKIISRNDGPYMLRWYVIPKNPIFNIYLHYFLQSDEDRALHDHPWFNCSILILGKYIEWIKNPDDKKEIEEKRMEAVKQGFFGFLHIPRNIPFERFEGHVYFRSPWTTHRVELIDKNPVITLFITGPIMRRWGFHCPRGWRYHKEFTKIIGNVSSVGKGCE